MGACGWGPVNGEQVAWGLCSKGDIRKLSLRLPVVVEGHQCWAAHTCRAERLRDAQLTMPPITRPREVDFGPPIRKATCYLYNLPEVVSTFECLRVPTVSARFSTAPFFWNWAMIAVARLAPRGFLEDRAKYAFLLCNILAPPAHHLLSMECGSPGNKSFP